jgi:hypothetical protein
MVVEQIVKIMRCLRHTAPTTHDVEIEVSLPEGAQAQNRGPLHEHHRV